MYTSHPVETHYFPLTKVQPHRVLLHTHTPAPYIPSSSVNYPPGVNFIIYSSGSTGCSSELHGLRIDIDWSATLGRWASRFPTTLVTWAIGIVALIIFEAWSAHEQTGGELFRLFFLSTALTCSLADVTKVSTSLSTYGRRTLPKLLLGSFVVAMLPLPSQIYLGTGGGLTLAPIAPLLVLIASGLVGIVWWILLIFMWPIAKISNAAFGRLERSHLASFPSWLNISSTDNEI